MLELYREVAVKHLGAKLVSGDESDLPKMQEFSSPDLVLPGEKSYLVFSAWLKDIDKRKALLSRHPQTT